MLSKTFWQVVRIQKRLRGRGSFHNTSSSLFNNTYSLPIPMGLFHPESQLNTKKKERKKKGWRIRGESWKRAHLHSREEACQPITWVTGSQAKLYRDGALGCQGSTKSEGDKGGKAFTTSAAETFVTHYKGNMAELPSPNPPSDWRYSFRVVMLYQTSSELDLSPTLAFSCE